MPLEQKDKVERVILSIIIAILLFATGSYISAFPVFIVVPAFVAFTITFILDDRKFSAAAGITIAALGSVIFSSPPSPIPHPGAPDEFVNNIIAARQMQMLTFSPPLLLGIIGGALGWTIATVTIQYKRFQKYIFWIVLALIVINTAWLSLDLNPDAVKMASEEPVAGKYNNFNSVNLKTFYLMKRHLGFYDAYSRAFSYKEDTFGKSPADTWSWRTPTVYYLWKWLLPPDGFYIFYLYLIAVAFSLYFVSEIAGTFLKAPLNLIAPAAMAYIFINGAVGFRYAFSEYWGMFFLLLGLWGLFKENKLFMILGFSLSLITRGFFVLPWLGITLVSFLMGQKKRGLLLLIPGGAYLLMLAYHTMRITSFPGVVNPPFQSWFQGGALHFIVSLFFGHSLLSRPLFIMPFVLLLFIFATVFLFKAPKGLLIPVGALLPMLIFLKAGPASFRPYWGIVYLPLVYLCASLILYRFERLRPEISLPSPGKKEVIPDENTSPIHPHEGDNDVESTRKRRRKKKK